jgi:serine phosphatase RsbU (regulator of sigma subunit)
VFGFRGKLDISRIVVAVVSLVLQAMHSFADASAFGVRFTHIKIWSSLIWKPLFTLPPGVEFPPERILSLALFAAILFATYRYILEAQARRMLLEGEVAGGREIQKVLVPDDIPQIEGYAITGSYTPMLEVGGDFFQVIPIDDGSAIVALGDVSGKGIKAGMNVSMIVGVLRAEAGLTSPAEMLGSLNRCLAGRMSGGFATGVVFRIDKDGTVTFANAGHLAPFLNGQEFPLEASLPLGLIAYSDYSEVAMQMQPGDQLTLYTDGVLEATNPDTKEMFGFERMSKLFASRPSAAEAAHAAIAFGQDDDVTVLTITRLHTGEEGTTSVESPVLDIDKA